MDALKTISSIVTYFLIHGVFASATVEVRFSPETDLSKYLIGMICNAKSTIDFAFYSIEDERIIDSLIKAKERGIRIRIVTEYDNANFFIDEDGDGVPERLGGKKEGIRRLFEAGIPVIEDGERMEDYGGGLMHNKFCIVDGRSVWTGSYNLTKRDLLYNNNSIKIESADLAQVFLDEFNELFYGVFHGGARTKNQKVYVGDSVVECYFSPEDDVQEIIMEEIEKAKSSIYFAMYAFTDEEIAELIIQKFHDGVDVRGIFDRDWEVHTYIDEEMMDAGIPVMLDTNPYIMHHKFIVVDLVNLIAGSYNLTRRAHLVNDENLLLVRNGDIALTFYGELRRMWGRENNFPIEDKISYVYASPNPAVTQTKIFYNLAGNFDEVRVRVFNIAGELIKTIFGGSSVGSNEVSFECVNEVGERISSGVYIIQVEAEGRKGSAFAFTKVAIRH